MTTDAEDYPNHEPVVDESYRLPEYIRRQLHLTISDDYERARRALPPVAREQDGTPVAHRSPFGEINHMMYREEPPSDDDA